MTKGLASAFAAAAVLASGLVMSPARAERYAVNPGAAAQNVPVKDLLVRVGTYINSFVGAFSNVVAEEAYTQETPSPRRKRQLRSDVMLVKYPGADGWLMFRDTFEVDGTSVRSARTADEAVPRARRIGRAPRA